MNRRDMLEGIGAVFAAEGVEGSVSAVEAEPEPPLMFVVHLHCRLSEKVQERIRQVVERTIRPIEKRYGCKIPVVVCEDEIEIEAVRDPRRTVKR